MSAGLSGPGSLHELAEASEVSPNGKRVALQKTLLQGTSSNGIKGMTILAVSVEYRSAKTGKRLREVHQPGDYYQSPSWVGNYRLLVFAPYNSYSPEVFVDTLGGSTDGWFSDEHSGEADPFGRQPIDDGELTRAGDRIAFVRGTNVKGDWSGALFEVDMVSSMSEIPTPFCSFVPPGPGPFSGPSWSPDGTEHGLEQRNRRLDRAPESVERGLRRNAPAGGTSAASSRTGAAVRGSSDLGEEAARSPRRERSTSASVVDQFDTEMRM